MGVSREEGYLSLDDVGRAQINRAMRVRVRRLDTYTGQSTASHE